MICQNCGTEIQLKDKFCRKCGAKVEEVNSVPLTEKLKKIKIIYKQNANELSILHDDKAFDLSRIKNMPIDKWLYPFLYDGIKWTGLYEELKSFIGCEKFILQFDGDENAFKMLQNALATKPVKLVGTNNNVVIIYSENPFTTKITVNGNIYNTQILQNRCLEEWLRPFQIRDIEWNGIFKELEDFIGIDTYTIHFIGEEIFLNTLIEECPKTVSIFYRDPNIKKNTKEVSNTSSINTDNGNMKNISDMARKTMASSKHSITDTGIGRTMNENGNLDNHDFSLKWYQFLTKIGMIFVMIMGTVSCVTHLWYVVTKGLIQVLPMVIFVLAISVSAYYLRKKLIAFKKDTPILLTIWFTVYILGMFIALITIYHEPFAVNLVMTIVELILVFLNHIYFKKREALFCN